VNSFGSTASTVAMKQLNSAMESGALFTEQYVVEVAGFGKLMVEEGAEVSAKAADFIKNDLTLFAKTTEPVSQQIKQKLPSCISQKNIAQKIRNVGDDILDVMEKAGGHTLERHIGKRNSDLTKRIAKSPVVKSASSFTNKRMAIKSVKENLRNNADEIASWLMTNPTLDQKKSFDFLHSYHIGKGAIKSTKKAPCDLVKSRVVLIPNSTSELGFDILTAFPIPH
jgi:hypothetical protein